MPGTLNLAGTVLRHVYLGSHAETHVRTSSGALCVVQSGNDGAMRLPEVNQVVGLVASASDCRVFPARA